MPGRNLAKPFAIAGFVLAEIYTFFAVLGPYGHERAPLTVQIPEKETVALFTPPPTSAKVTRVLVSAFFMGPLGAAVGTGIGLLVSGALGDFRRRDAGSPEKPAPPQ